MMKKIYAFFILLAACVTALAQKELPLPDVPSDLTVPRLRAEYILDRFWDAMDWRDTTLTRDAEFMEQNAANFYNLFQFTDSAGVARAARRMLDGAKTDRRAYRDVAEIAELYLFEPESPVVDEESFIVVADLLLGDDMLDESDRLRIEDARAAAMLNRVGHAAADFEMITREGDHIMLSEVAKRHPVNILMFYDPDCHDCGELERFLADSELGDAGIIMVSPYGEQDGLWARHAATMPERWIVARPVSEEFDDEGLYDIRLTPTVYLLDSSATVLAKHLRRENILKSIDKQIACHGAKE
ncbi:MAG: DUF5106 domain-containing protein [Muribaculaceae bacterium]|nr:DUF5106 domain-containing protein [Muribaculaceae bacterium]